MTSQVEAFLSRVGRMVLDEQVLLHHQCRERHNVGTLRHLFLGFIEREQEHFLQNLGDLGNFHVRALNFAIGHSLVLSKEVLRCQPV